MIASEPTRTSSGQRADARGHPSLAWWRGPPGRVYLHVLDWPAGRELVLPALDGRVREARLL